jgi:hydrophobic/amphiphilic exporter-1 (mainly G- bacteria), HAE1 family
MRSLLPAFAVRRPVTVLMLLVAICVAGLGAVSKIPLQMMPSGFSPPFLWAWVPYEQSSPIEAERTILRPMEAQLATVPGVKNLYTRASTESAGFFIELHGSTEAADAYNAISDRMERAMLELPDDVGDFRLFRYNPDDEPVLWAGASLPEGVLDAYATLDRGLLAELERIPGVAKVDIWGVEQKQVIIEFDRELLMAHGVDLGQLIQSLMADNFQGSGGVVIDYGSERYLRSLSVWETVDDIADTPIGEGLTVSDVATVELMAPLTTDIGRIDGRSAIGIGIYKESTANTVAVTTAARALLEGDASTDWGDGDLSESGKTIQTFIFFDQGETITEAIDNLKSSALQGGLLAVLVLFLFLREVRMTMMVAAAIPLSMLTTVGIVFATGGTLNLLTLLGLMIAVGMVVDNSIVVTETIFKHRLQGASPREAAVSGTAEVSLAILLSTMTTMVVFLPLILMSKDAMFSFFMGELGMPVIYALGASLVVALLFTPLSTLLVKQQKMHEPKSILWLTKYYKRALSWLLSHRKDSSMGLLGLVFITVMVPMSVVQCSEESDNMPGEFTVNYNMGRDATYYEAEDTTALLEEWIESHKEEWGVDIYRIRYDGDNGRGWMQVQLTDELSASERSEVMEAVDDNLPVVVGVDIYRSRSSGGEYGGNNIEIELFGDDPELLASVTDEVRQRIAALDTVLKVDNPLEGGNPEILVQLDDAAMAQSGVVGEWAARTISFAMRGLQISEWREEGSEYPVMARYSVEDRAGIDALMNLPVYGSNGVPTPLRAVTDLEHTEGFGQINRRNGIQGVGLSIELQEDTSTEDAMLEISTAMSSVVFPPGVTWSDESYRMERDENFEDQQKAMILSSILVFLLMGILFESFLLPFAIIMTLPMAGIGVYWTLYITNTSFDMMVGIGLVILIGVVVNNGIVLIDRVTNLRDSGHSREEALIMAGERRLRPILMTAITTITGLLPMAFGTRSFVGIPYAPLGISVAGGLATATLLTLFLLPILYTIFDDLRGVVVRYWGYVLANATERE